MLKEIKEYGIMYQLDKRVYAVKIKEDTKQHALYKFSEIYGAGYVPLAIEQLLSEAEYEQKKS